MGLLSIAAILRKEGLNVSYIDCLDRFHPEEKKNVKVFWDGRGPFRKTQINLPSGVKDFGKRYSRYGIKPEWFIQDLKNIPKPDLIFVTSLMTYWATGVKETIEIIKQVFPTVPLILGGIYASLCHDHAIKETLADQVIQGPGENKLYEIIKDHTGFKISNLSCSKDLDDLPFPALDLQNRITYAPILTSRGCPFSCEYCASGYLEPTLRRRASENVFKEIQHWNQSFQIKNFAFYDDALLVKSSKYAFPLFERIIQSKMELNFHTPNAIHIKGVTKQAAQLMFEAGFKTIRLGLETTDFSQNRDHDVKVAENDFFKAVDHLKAAGFEKSQLGAYLLCGMPQQNLDDVELSMNLVKKTGILPVLAFYTPIPHTKMWDQAVKHSIYNLVEHPVFTNNTLFPCVKDQDDLRRISRLKNLSN